MVELSLSIGACADWTEIRKRSKERLRDSGITAVERRTKGWKESQEGMYSPLKGNRIRIIITKKTRTSLTQTNVTLTKKTPDN